MAVIIGLTGRARSGKDTVGQHYVQNHGFGRWALATPIKAMVHAGFNLNPDDYVTHEQREAIIPWLGCSIRHLWQTLGTQWGRDCVNTAVWLMVAQEACGRMIGNGARGVVITDVRFENEAEWVRSAGGVVVHVKRPDAPQLEGASQNHESEKGVEIGPRDRVIVNDQTLPDLYKDASNLLFSIIGSEAMRTVSEVLR